jgi:hypothetical protein
MAKKPTKSRKKPVKAVHPRKPAKPNARQAVKAKTRAKKRPKQKFHVSHADGAAFDQGLRAYAAYRDLGLSPATDGLVQGHVIRFVGPYAADDAGKPHYHDVDLQLIYVLKGWYKAEFEGEGVHTFRAGSCWLQPPKIKHTVLGYSDDCELLEIVLPAEFDTVTLEK